MKKTVTLEDFKEKHATLKKRHVEMKAKLKEAFKLARSLAKEADKLYHAGSYSLYFFDGSKTCPASYEVPSMMEDLDAWRTIDIDLSF